jgi:hypothetical protein
VYPSRVERDHRDGAMHVEVTEEANARYFAEMTRKRKRHRQIFGQDSCRLANSYYFDKYGDVPLHPGPHWSPIGVVAVLISTTTDSPAGAPTHFRPCRTPSIFRSARAVMDMKGLQPR